MSLHEMSRIYLSRLSFFVHYSGSVEKLRLLRGDFHVETLIILWDLKGKQCEKEN